MKKLTAILLLLLFLFNLAGYRLFFQYIQYKHEASVQTGIDNDAYEQSKLIEFRVPLTLNMPYPSPNGDFERIDGNITIDGRAYKCVKRKFDHGQVVLLCLADDKKATIEHAKNEFGSHVNDLPLSGKKAGDSFKKIVFTSEFEESAKQTIATISTLIIESKVQHISMRLTPVFLQSTDKPPQLLHA